MTDISHPAHSFPRIEAYTVTYENARVLHVDLPYCGCPSCKPGKLVIVVEPRWVACSGSVGGGASVCGGHGGA